MALRRKSIDPIQAMADALSEDINMNNGLSEVVEHSTLTEEDKRTHKGWSDPIGAITEEMAKIEELKADGDEVIQPPMIDINRIRDERARRDAWERERLRELDRSSNLPRPLPPLSSDIRIVGASASRVASRGDRFELPAPTLAPAPAPVVNEEVVIPTAGLGERKLRL